MNAKRNENKSIEGIVIGGAFLLGALFLPLLPSLIYAYLFYWGFKDRKNEFGIARFAVNFALIFVLINVGVRYLSPLVINLDVFKIAQSFYLKLPFIDSFKTPFFGLKLLSKDLPFVWIEFGFYISLILSLFEKVVLKGKRVLNITFYHRLLTINSYLVKPGEFIEQFVRVPNIFLVFRGNLWQGIAEYLKFCIWALPLMLTYATTKVAIYPDGRKISVINVSGNHGFELFSVICGLLFFSFFVFKIVGILEQNTSLLKILKIGKSDTQNDSTKGKTENFELLLGKSESNSEIVLSDTDLNRHIHVIGQSGSGKSVLLKNIYAEIIFQNKGLAFLDLKADGDVLNSVIGLAKNSNRLSDLEIIHLSKPEISVGYNPLKRGNATELKDKILGALDWSEIYYKKVSERVLQTILRGLVFVRDQKIREIKLKDLSHCLSKREAIVELASEIGSKNSALRSDLIDLSNELKNPQFSRQIEGIRTDLEVLVKSEFSEIFNKEHEIDLLDSIDRNKIVYILLDSQMYGESSKRLGKMILSDLKSASGAIIEKGNTLERDLFTIIIDEFSDLASENFAGFLNKARGSKIGIVMAHQELGDLEKVSNSFKDQIIGNSIVTISFLQKNPKSAEALASIIGTKKALKETRSTEKGLIFEYDTGKGSVREVEEFIIHPNEFKSLNVGEAILIRKDPSFQTKFYVNNPELPLGSISDLKITNSSKSSIDRPGMKTEFSEWEEDVSEKDFK